MKTVISKIGDLPLSIVYDDIVYFVDGTAYKRKINNFSKNELSVNYTELQENCDFFNLNLNQTVVDVNDDILIIDKKTILNLIFDKKSKKLKIEGKGFSEGLDIYLKNIKILDMLSPYEKRNIRKFAILILKEENIYQEIINCLTMNNIEIDYFYLNLIKVYLTDNGTLLKYILKFELFDFLSEILLSELNTNILNEVNKINEQIINKFCVLFKSYKADYFKTILSANSNFNKNEMELLYKFTEMNFKLNTIFPDINSEGSFKIILDRLVEIKLLCDDFTKVLDTITKELFKNYSLYKLNEVITNYRDYLMMLDEFKNLDELQELDMTRYPKNIFSAHDKILNKIKVLRAESGNSRKDIDIHQIIEFKNAVNNYKNLEYKNDDYEIITPKTPSDLIHESDKLNHCVDSYISAVASKKSKILFCRKVENISESYMTIEIVGSELVQSKKHTNTYPNDIDIAFLREYCSAKNLIISAY